MKRANSLYAEKVDVSCSYMEVAANISCHRIFNGGISIKLTKQGKTWSIARSNEEFNKLQKSLEKEFSGVLTLPPAPVLADNTSVPLDAVQGYINTLVNHPSIRTSSCLQQFVELQEERVTPVVKTSKRGLLTLKEGKNHKYEVTVENRLLYCKGHKSEVCEVAMLLDNCEVTPQDECGFSVTSGSRNSSAKRKTVLGKLSQNGASQSVFYFIACDTADRDEWVEVIRAAGREVQDATFNVSGRLTVEVVEGRNLAPKDFHLIRANTSDPYVVLRIERQQVNTRTINRNLNPVWNEEFSFGITQNQGMLFVLVYDEDRLSRSDSMGQVVFPLSGIPPGILHDIWLPVLPRKPHEKISGEVRLRLKYDFVKEEEPAGPIFGMFLTEICDNPSLCNDGVPIFFAKFLSHLEKIAMNEQGIFRISGSFPKIKEIKHLIDQGKDVTLNETDVHNVSGVLKLYLRELPVPLMTYENYTKLIDLTNLSSEKEMLQQLKMIFVVIPPAHIGLLRLLLPSLKRFSENSKVNMMTTSNLAIVFGPSLIRPQVDNFETVLHTANISTLTSLMIDHHPTLFY